MLEIWQRSSHILPDIAFEKRFWQTVLLPIKTESVRKDIARLTEIITSEIFSTESQLTRHAGLNHRLRYGRTRILLHMRKGLDWDSTDIGPDMRIFSALSDTSIAKRIPHEISIEYLVAELERHGFEFRVQIDTGLLVTSRPTAVMPRQEVDAWLEEFGRAIAVYVANRDGIWSAVRAPDRFVWEPPNKVSSKALRPNSVPQSRRGPRKSQY